MADYEDVRRQVVADAYQSLLAHFLAGYRKGRKTAILLPGGMGSQLLRSAKRFSGEPVKFKDFDVVWIDGGLLLSKDALTLEIEPDQRDKDSYIIAPDGPMRFLPLITAYEGTEAFFRLRGINFCVFGFDWRHSIEECASLLHSFLTDFKTEVMNKYNENPLPDTTLLCHCQGGWVATSLMHLPNTIGAELASIVTIATPFYGNGNQAQYYFEGQSVLNHLHGAAKITPKLGTIPGPYLAMPMDFAMWQKRKEQLGLAGAYPVLDENSAPADPFDSANQGRFPSWVSQAYISDALHIRNVIDSDLPGALIAKFFHLRANTTNTNARFRWGPLPANYVPGKSLSNYRVDVAAKNGGMTAGDGTVAEFSAALVQTDKAQVRTIPTGWSHQYLAENKRFLEAVEGIIATGQIPTIHALGGIDDSGFAPEARPEASRDEVYSFLSDIASHRALDDDPRLKRPDIARGLMRELLR